MSDTFNHELDAWQSLAQRFGEDGDFEGFPGQYASTGDPNYYHSWEEIGGIVRETEKAYLIHALPQIPDFNVWVAKSLIRRMSQDKKRIFVHLATYNNAIKNRIKEMQDAVNSFDVLD